MSGSSRATSATGRNQCPFPIFALRWAELVAHTGTFMADQEVPLPGGGCAKFGEVNIIDCADLSRALFTGSRTLVDAPTQSGKTCAAAASVGLGALSRRTTVTVVSAPVNSVQQMVSDKMADAVAAFGAIAYQVDNNRPSNSEMDSISVGARAPVAHWNRLQAVLDLVDDAKIISFVLNLDEVDDMFANLDESSRDACTQRERLLRTLVRHSKCVGIVAISATHTGTLRAFEAAGIRFTSRLTPTPDRLAAVGYRGHKAFTPLLDGAGEPIFMPAAPAPHTKDPLLSRAGNAAAKKRFDDEKSQYPFQEAHAFGIKSPQIAALFEGFVERDQGRMLLSLGGKVHGEGGFAGQARYILTTLAPDAAVFIFAADGLTQCALLPNGILKKTRCKKGEGVRNATPKEAMDACGASHSALLTQGCAKRGTTFGVDFTDMGAYASEGFNFTDFVQLTGRATGRGFHQDRTVTVLMMENDFRAIGEINEVRRDPMVRLPLHVVCKSCIASSPCADAS